MDRSHATLLATCFCAISVLAACGDASGPRIDGPGAHNTGVPTPDAGADHDYRDPNSIDGGCQLPNMLCNGVCIAVDSDPQNCGACGNACLSNDAVCIAGKCGCSGNLIDYCDNVGCMDVSADFNNCGSCGHACDPNTDQACSDGNCVPNDP